MLWNTKRNRKLKIVLTLVITLIVLLCPFLDCFGVFYAEEFPSEVGLSGGYFVKLTKVSNNLDFCLLIPANQIENFTFQGNGTLVNLTNTTISTKIISLSNNTVFNARFPSLSALQYLSNNSSSWVDFGDYTILDMNIYPKSDNPQYSNQNLHLSYDTKNLVIIITLLVMLLVIFRSVKHD